MTININIKENKILINPKYDIQNYRINIYNWNPYTNEKNIIYYNQESVNKNVIYWYSPNMIFKDMFGVFVTICDNDLLIKEEKFRIKTKFGGDIKNQALIIYASVGMGDNLQYTPSIRKLYNSYNRKITLYTYFPEAFINNPYIENIIKIENIEDIVIDENEFEIHRIGHSYYLPFNIINKATRRDMVNLFSEQIGIDLRNDEKNLNFFPEECEIPDIPKPYVVINPNYVHRTRTWGSNNWNKLIKHLEDSNIFIVMLGKEVNYDVESKSYCKDIILNKGLNLISKTTLSQAWHIINNSNCIVTHSSGLYALSLTTDVNIIELGVNVDFSDWRYRNGILNYKHYYIEGFCENKECVSNLYNYVSEHGTINTRIPGGECFFNYSELKCHPSPEQIFEKIKELL